MNEDGLLKKNAELQQKLNKENKEYYGDLLVYIRLKTLARSEQKSEEILLEILEDILEGQAKGVSAEEYLGKNPKQIGDEITKELPISFKYFLKLIGSTFGVSFVFKILKNIVSYNNTIDVGAVLITSFLLTVAVFLTIYFMRFSVFYHYRHKSLKIIMPGLFVAVLAVPLYLTSELKTKMIIEVSNITAIIMIVLLLAIFGIIFYRVDNKKFWLPLVSLLSVLAAVGIVIRLDFLRPFLESSSGQPIIGAVMFIVLVLSLYFVWRGVKNLR